MIYRSNLTAPDLVPHFKHLHSRVMGHSMGHDVPSDWADKADDDPVFGIYKNCGMWTHDEAAILYNVARNFKGLWLDIGAHTGWTTMHAACAGPIVVAVDPMLKLQGFHDRFQRNTATQFVNLDSMSWRTSDQYFRLECDTTLDGVVIDGDHEPGKPLEDAQNAVAHLADTGVILLHDGVGRPVREAVQFLVRERFHARVYYTPHLVFCCWRGDFKPPDHVPDPIVKAQHRDGRYEDFDWSRCE